MIELTHIIPRFAPQIDGLGDYGRLLALELGPTHGFESRCIVGDSLWNRLAEENTPPFPVAAVRERTAAELLRLLGDAETVVLHYVGYGYDRRGIPFWINQGLQKWKRSAPGCRLVVVFHELWASGPPWKTEFYTSLVQRWLCRRLHRLADAAMTSVPINVRRLDAIEPGKTVFQPIPSNLPTGASGRAPTTSGRPIDVVAFGQEASRFRSLSTHERFLRALNEKGRLGRVRIVGKCATLTGDDARLVAAFLPQDRIEVHPDVAPEEGGRLLRASDLFVSFYPSAFLCKSGALMAALGNGCVPLLAESTNAAPLAEGRELVACDGTDAAIDLLLRRIDAGELDRIAVTGRQWHDTHASWEAVVKNLVPLLGCVPGSGPR
jgi:hypothetical protein